MKKNTLFHKSLFRNFKHAITSVGLTAAIDIGSSSIKIVEFKKTKTGVSLNNFVYVPFPASAKTSEAESIKFIVETLRNARKQEKIVSSKISLVLTGKEVNVLSLNIPKVSKKDIRNAVFLNIKKQVLFNPTESFFDFQVALESIDRTGPKLDLIVAVANKQAVDKKIYILQESGIKPADITIIPNAIGNILQSTGKIEPEEVAMALEIGAKQSVLCIFKGSNLQFSRDITVAGDNITQGLVRKITLQDKELDITYDLAEKIKMDCGIPLKEELEDKIEEGLAKSHIMTMMRPSVERLSNEVLRSVNYYRQRFKTAKISKLFLSGGGSNLKNIEQFLGTNLKEIKIEKLNPLDALSEQTVLEEADRNLLEGLGSRMSVVFGMGLGGKKPAMDLLPIEVKIQEKLAILKFVLRFTVPFIVAVLILFYVTFSAQVAHYRNISKEAQATLDSFELTRELIEEYDALKKRMEQRKDLLEKAVGRQPLWSGALRELGQITPDGVTLSKLSVEKGQRPFKLKIEGEIVPSYTTVDMALSQYLMALDESPFFENVELVSQARDVYSATPRARFEIVLKLVY